MLNRPWRQSFSATLPLESTLFIFLPFFYFFGHSNDEKPAFLNMVRLAKPPDKSAHFAKTPGVGWGGKGWPSGSKNSLSLTPEVRAQLSLDGPAYKNHT